MILVSKSHTSSILFESYDLMNWGKNMQESNACRQVSQSYLHLQIKQWNTQNDDFPFLTNNNKRQKNKKLFKTCDNKFEVGVDESLSSPF